MAISAHLDESGTHKGSPFTVVGGNIATAKRWANFSEQWERMLRKYKVSAYNSTQFFARKGDFDGWSDKQWHRFYNHARAILQKHMLFSMAVGVNRADHEDFRKNLKVKRYRKDSAYGACFRQCMAISCEAASILYPGERVSFVLESGAHNSGDAQRIFDESKHPEKYGEWQAYEHSALLDGLTVTSGIRSLEAADLIANEWFRDLLAGLPANPDSERKLIRGLLDREHFEEELAPAVVRKKWKMTQHWLSRVKKQAGNAT